MPLDVLLLGPIAFTDYSPPECMPFGGRQQMAVHKLIGGQRVIDTLSPDDEDIQWSGRFFGAGALSTCLVLDSLRAAGQVLPLSYAGMGYPVVIQDFRADIRRLPLWVEYEIRCVVSTNGAHGSLGAIVPGVEHIVTADINAALALVASGVRSRRREDRIPKKAENKATYQRVGEQGGQH